MNMGKLNDNDSGNKNEDLKYYNSFKVVLFYCSLIVFLPVSTFFGLNGLILRRFFTLTEIQTNIYSAIGAVVALHFALAIYIYRAYCGVGSTNVIQSASSIKRKKI